MPTVNLTPTPRILRMLGDITFDHWQCFAELIDNSLDAFRYAELDGTNVENARVDITWSSSNVAAADREIVVQDNGPGMTLKELRDAAKAGYTGNDPVDHLGLFGMGFNVATARLGDLTTFLSATKESDEWIGVQIDFEELVRNRTFDAPIVHEPKNSQDESGTRVRVGKLKENVFHDLQVSNNKRQIKMRLETTYTTILEQGNTSLFLQGNLLRPRPHCVWGESRFVMRSGQQVLAKQIIDQDLGVAWFDVELNRYVSEDDNAKYDILESNEQETPDYIRKRRRHLHGWIGIQRYFDKTQYGLDFIRNGRKILTGMKDLFDTENPDTGSKFPEYPVELGATQGGRIVGELHTDYLIPTYKKDAFNLTDIAWKLTVDHIRGPGPLLPNARQVLGLPRENTSPLGLLVNAYRHFKAGSKNLALQREEAQRFRKRYEGRDHELISDEKWYTAVQEADAADDAPTPDTPQGPLTDPDDFDRPNGPGEGGPPTAPAPETTGRNDLRGSSERVESLCGKYTFDRRIPGFDVTARKVTGIEIMLEGRRSPACAYQDGVNIDFYYDPRHRTIAKYPLTPKQLLLSDLTHRFSTRHTDKDTFTILSGLIDEHLGEERIDPETLKATAAEIFEVILEKLPLLLKPRIEEVLEIVRQNENEAEELQGALLRTDPALCEVFLSGGERASECLAYLPNKTLQRLVDRMPEAFLDGEIFNQPYTTLTGTPQTSMERLKEDSKSLIVNYLNDLVQLLDGNSRQRSELLRAASTLELLDQRLAV